MGICPHCAALAVSTLPMIGGLVTWLKFKILSKRKKHKHKHTPLPKLEQYGGAYVGSRGARP